MSEPNQTPVSMQTITADYLTQQNELAARYEEQQARLRGELPPEELALEELVPFGGVNPHAVAPKPEPTTAEFLKEQGIELPPPFSSLQPRTKPGPVRATAGTGTPPTPVVFGPEPPHVQHRRSEPIEIPTLDEHAIRGEPDPELCMCGMPGTPGVVHRVDAPCYYASGRTDIPPMNREAVKPDMRFAAWLAGIPTKESRRELRNPEFNEAAARAIKREAETPTAIEALYNAGWKGPPKPFNPWPWFFALAGFMFTVAAVFAAFVAYLYLHR